MPDPASPLVSVIVRAKNEERWIAPCLRAVFNQTYRHIEVVLVDNQSTDQTVRRAQEFPVTVVPIADFTPGRAINDGVRASRGEIIVCLSGHCVPVNNVWLETLIRNLADPIVAGVYGRQQPLSYSSDFDKRDLLTVFGLDRKVQIRDSFFHNANSAMRRSTWEAFPFDEQVTNIEDRLWGQQVIAAGRRIVYEPDASVYHWHGLHHDLNPERARRIVRILESLDGFSSVAGHHDPADLKTLAIVPLRGRSRAINRTTLLDYTIRSARAATLVKDVVVATDDAETAALARTLGARAPFLRPKELSEDYVDIVDVLRFALEQIESTESVPDLVVVLEETYPFRTGAMLDAMVRRVVAEGLDTIVAAKRERRGIWLEQDGRTELLAEGFMPRAFKRTNAMVGLMGLACVTHPVFVRQGDLVAGRVGIFDVTDPLASIEVRDERTAQLITGTLDAWWTQRQVPV
jgi:cellulose synthase/poly-beta-1,6-N-acetylglucosamine synthase-like glycosyltransferase